MVNWQRFIFISDQFIILLQSNNMLAEQLIILLEIADAYM